MPYDSIGKVERRERIARRIRYVRAVREAHASVSVLQRVLLQHFGTHKKLYPADVRKIAAALAAHHQASGSRAVATLCKRGYLRRRVGLPDPPRRPKGLHWYTLTGSGADFLCLLHDYNVKDCKARPTRLGQKEVQVDETEGDKNSLQLDGQSDTLCVEG